MTPRWRRFRSRVGSHALVLAGTQILDTSDDADLDDAALAPYLAYGDSLRLDAVPSVAPQSMSLNLTAACNLACDYCYADRGAFGGRQAGGMCASTAERAIDALLAGATRTARATIGFLGGEPFLRREALHHAVAYAAARAAALGQPLGFSVTTNGTLLDDRDHELLRRHPFAVTVSLDGGRATHDRRRLTLFGAGSWDDALARVRPLLADPGDAQVSARATVTGDDLDLAARLDALAAEGFTTIGLSPVRLGAGALADAEWPRWTAAAIALGERELAAILRDGHTPFDNLRIALRRLHAGSASPYPCGAGGGYFSVSTQGTWYACHRAIGDARYEMGTSAGLDAARRRDFLAAHHVEADARCRVCWARYLCSGGCHQEAAARSDASCDAVRGWLDFCLDAYCTIVTRRPAWFGGS